MIKERVYGKGTCVDMAGPFTLLNKRLVEKRKKDL